LIAKFFYDVLEYEVQRARRYEYFVALLLVAVDRPPAAQAVRRVEAIGKVLVEVLRDEIRSTDLIGRMSNDRFAVLLPYVSAPALTRIAERISSRIANYTFPLKGAERQTVTLGGACFPTHATEAAGLLAAADAALARAAGRVPGQCE
jgi:diguanylate cyclase (GGDEF)-like protein